MGYIESSIGKVALNDNAKMKKFIVSDPDDSSDNEDDYDDEGAGNLHQIGRMTQDEVDNKNFKEERNMVEAATGYVSKTSTAQKQNDPDAMLQEVSKLRKQKNVIKPDKKRKLEALLGLKQITETIEIDGLKIVLKSLTASDMKSAIVKVTEISQTQLQSMIDSKLIFLCLSLYSIDDDLMSDILGEDDNVDMRLSLVENMASSVVDELFEVYDKKIDIKLPRTAQEVKEVASDIKKS